MPNNTLLYKILALYLLERSEAPVSGTHLCEFFVDQGYSDYFAARSVINDLAESGMLDVNTTNNITMYGISPLGKDTLSAMKDRINETNIADVQAFLSRHSISIRADRDLYADYDRASYGGYIVHLRASEDSRPIMELTLSVSSIDQAQAICTNWKKNHVLAYQAIFESLI